MSTPLVPDPGVASPAPAPSPGRGALRRIAAALSHRDFRVLWSGACMSTIGTWMQKVAQSWLVLTITGSAFYLGLDQFLGEVPILLFTLIGGVVADRHNRRRMLLTSQYVQMSCAFVLMTIVYFDVVEVWHILALSFVAGTAQAFGGPAFQSLIPDLVPKEHLPNAIALNSIQFNIARVIGPLAAGVAMAAFGAAICFGLNGLSFLFVIVALGMLRVVHVPRARTTRMVDELRGGVRYVRDERRLVRLTTLAFVQTFLGLPLLTFLPVFAQDIFKQGVAQYSEMMAFSGAGAVVGALVVAWFGKFPRMGRALLVGQVVFGALVVAFSISRTLWVSHLLLFAAGATLIVVFSLLTSLVQLLAPNELRGRVVSIYMVAFRGGSPLGSLVAGYAASLWSAPAVLAVNGVLLVLVGGWSLVRERALRDV